MADVLQNYLERRINVLTNDGKVIVGTFKGFDQTINLILTDSEERVFSEDSGVEVEPLGLYVIRGDNVCRQSFFFTYNEFNVVLFDRAVVGEIDEALDAQLNLQETTAAPLRPIVH